MTTNWTSIGSDADNGAASTLSVRGATVSFTDAGVIEPVVLLHGSASDSRQWRALGDRLEDSFRVLTPDLFGYGKSDAWPGRGALTMNDEAAPVGALISRCAEPVHVVGHSFGGAVALRAALDYPGCIRSLTLIEPVAFNVLRAGGEDDRALYAEIARLGETVGAAALTGDSWGGMARFVDYWNGAGAWSRMSLDRREALAGCILRVAQNFCAAAGEGKTLDAYAGIDVPTLILRGGDSPAPARRVAELLASAIPGARFATIGHAGHMLPLTHADIVNTEIAEHLARNTGAWRQAA